VELSYISICFRNLSFSVCRYSVNLSYASSPSDHTLSGATIGELFNKQVEATPDRDMIVFSRDNVRLTYQQFKSKVRYSITFYCYL